MGCSKSLFPAAHQNHDGEDRKVAAEKLDRLLRLPTEQKKKYGSVMDP